jgi:class 3 adenylate cyclase
MSLQQISLSILYADICDSVRLYEKVGDAEAHRLAENCMRRLADITGRHGGRVIRTQGDGVMSTFPSAVCACDAAQEMQEAHVSGPVFIKVGFNHGAVIPDAGDVYGDAVNLAARVIGLARAGEILTTQETVQHLKPEQRLSARMLDRTKVKGKSEPINIYALVNDEDTQATVFSTVRTFGQGDARRKALGLEYRGRRLNPESLKSPLFMGRADECQLVVESDFASRMHAFIESKKDYFVLTDQSTNGTYLVSTEGERMYLKRESVRLPGSGVISLGIRPEDDDDNLIRFRIGRQQLEDE